jgi:hypothetical protein
MIFAEESQVSSPIVVACNWLAIYLVENQPVSPVQVRRDAKLFADIDGRTLARAAIRLGVVVRVEHCTTNWRLPGVPAGQHKTGQQLVKGTDYGNCS